MAMRWCLVFAVACSLLVGFAAVALCNYCPPERTRQVSEGVFAGALSFLVGFAAVALCNYCAPERTRQVIEGIFVETRTRIKSLRWRHLGAVAGGLATLVVWPLYFYVSECNSEYELK